MQRIATCLFGLALGVSTSRAASPPSIPDSLQSCTVINDDAARLACFDREIDRLSGAAKHSPQAAPAAPLVAEEQQTFGLSPEAVRKLKNPNARAAAAKPKLAAKLSHVSVLADSHLLFTLDNGQIWEQTEIRAGFSAAAGDSVTIEPGALGSFWLSVSAKRATRVRRVS